MSEGLYGGPHIEVLNRDRDWWRRDQRTANPPSLCDTVDLTWGPIPADRTAYVSCDTEAVLSAIESVLELSVNISESGSVVLLCAAQELLELGRDRGEVVPAVRATGVASGKHVIASGDDVARVPNGQLTSVAPRRGYGQPGREAPGISLLKLRGARPYRGTNDS